MCEGGHLEQWKTGQGHGGFLRVIPLAAKEISLTASWVHSSVLFALQLGHNQMGDRKVLKVFR